MELSRPHAAKPPMYACDIVHGSYGVPDNVIAGLDPSMKFLNRKEPSSAQTLQAIMLDSRSRICDCAIVGCDRLALRYILSRKRTKRRACERSQAVGTSGDGLVQ